MVYLNDDSILSFRHHGQAVRICFYIFIDCFNTSFNTNCFYNEIIVSEPLILLDTRNVRVVDWWAGLGQIVNLCVSGQSIFLLHGEFGSPMDVSVMHTSTLESYLTSQLDVLATLQGMFVLFH